MQRARKIRKQVRPRSPEPAPPPPLILPAAIALIVVVAFVLAFLIYCLSSNKLFDDIAASEPRVNQNSGRSRGTAKPEGLQHICRTIHLAHRHGEYGKGSNPPLLHDVLRLTTHLATIGEITYFWSVELERLYAEQARLTKDSSPAAADVNQMLKLVHDAGAILTDDKCEGMERCWRAVYEAEILEPMLVPKYHLLGEKVLREGEDRKRVLRRVCGPEWF